MSARRDAAAAAGPSETKGPVQERFEMPQRGAGDSPEAGGLRERRQRRASADAADRIAVSAVVRPYVLKELRERAPVHRHEEPQELVVGSGIRVDGLVSGCVTLVVDGEVKATIEATEHLIIRAGGHVAGRGEVETAEIAGAFEGTLVVRGRLLIRRTGRVAGDVRFGELEIERGGQLKGSVDTHAAAVTTASASA